MCTRSSALLLDGVQSCIIMGYKVLGIWIIRLRSAIREQVDFPLRAVELNLHIALADSRICEVCFNLI